MTMCEGRVSVGRNVVPQLHSYARQRGGLSKVQVTTAAGVNKHRCAGSGQIHGIAFTSGTSAQNNNM